jgi:glyoxylase-like metal-dependent hydrolase (beta-lactamase superfamily II)
MDIHKIVIPTPFPVGDVNTFLVKGDALTLFDAGIKTDEAFEAMKWGIRAAGYSIDDVEQVVLTHHHPDHIGLVEAFPKANLYAHPIVGHWMDKDPNFISYNEAFYKQELMQEGVPAHYIDKVIGVRAELRFMGSKPLTAALKEGDEVPGHPGLIALETPGHAQSHLVFYEAATGQCIGGDLLLDKVSSNPLVEPPASLNGERPKSLLQYNDSLKRIRDLNVKIVYAGHGEEVTNVGELVNDRLAKQHERAMKVQQMLTTPQSVYEVTQNLFRKIYKAQLGLTLSETLGQLDYLVANGLAEFETHEGVDYYVATSKVAASI